MCRAGGRRCPGQYDPAKAAERNARRRAQRADAKLQGGDASLVSPKTLQTTLSATRGVEDKVKFAPLTELHLEGADGERMEPVIHAMENLATTLEAQGEHESANAVRFGGREIAAANEVRTDMLQAYYRRRMMQAHMEGKTALQNTYGTLMNLAGQAEYIKDGGPIGEEYSQGSIESFKQGNLWDRSKHAKHLMEIYQEKLSAETEARGRQRLFKAGDKEYTATEILSGHTYGGEKITPESLREATPQVYVAMSHAADDLVGAVCADGAPSKRNLTQDYDFIEVKDAPEFHVIGDGAESIAYLHSETGLVYKVPHRDNSVALNRSLDMDRVNKINQEAYAMVDDKALEEHGVENIKTVFITSKVGEDRHHIQVQPYCDPSDWEPMKLSLVSRKKLKAVGVTDLHEGNVRVNAQTGEIRLIDCTPVDRGIGGTGAFV